MSTFAATQNFRLNHTMFRIRDPEISLPFYTEILGMKLIGKMEIEAAKFTNYFLGFPSPSDEKLGSLFHREALLELCHNWGTESDPEFKGYHSGNQPPQGFGHIAITCDDIHKTCDYFEAKQVKFQKRPKDGLIKDIAFVLDPDGYWIELVSKDLKM